jgi:hypothetical protein
LETALVRIKMSDADTTQVQEQTPAPPTTAALRAQRRALRAAAAAEAGYILSVRGA